MFLHEENVEMVNLIWQSVIEKLNIYIYLSIYIHTDIYVNCVCYILKN